MYSKADLCLSNSYGNMMDLKDNFNVTKLAYIHNPFNLETMSKKEIEIYFCDSWKAWSREDAIKNMNADLWIIGNSKLYKRT